MGVIQRLQQMGLVLPVAPEPAGVYVPVKVSGKMVFVSGMLPLKDGRLMATGIVPEQISVEMASECARQCVLNALAAMEREVGLNRIKGPVRMNGYIASSSEFYEHPKVLNPASELLLKLFGPNGQHTRIAVGVYRLPMNSPVELDFIFELL